MVAAEDRNLAPEQFPELNRQFYAGEFGPADYLTQRLRSVFLATQAPENLPCAFDAQLSGGDVHATWATPDSWTGNNGWDRNGQTDEVMPNLLAECEQAGLTLTRIKQAMESVGYSKQAVHQVEPSEQPFIGDDGGLP